MTMKFREVTMLLSLAEAANNLAAAFKDGKSVKKFLTTLEDENDVVKQQTDKILSDAGAESEKIVAKAHSVASDLGNEAAAEVGRRMKSLGEGAQRLKHRTTDADVRDRGLIERTEALVKRTENVAEREEAVTVRENTSANVKEVLENTQTRLTNWEQALDARDSRVRAAVA